MQNESNNSKNIFGYVFIAILLYISFLMLKARTWVGEDAFIFFKYIDNFVHGHGLVFNLGERVEGFTAPLWVFLLSIFRFFTGFELRPTAIVVGFILTLIALGYLLVNENNKKYTVPLGLILLISNSAFRDFSTSGFETSLTYLLLILFAVNFKKNYINRNVSLLGLLLSLLVLNRPESFLLFVYVFILLFIKNAKTSKKILFKYLLPFFLTVIPYQIFRMGYFASLLPNTFYAKKGGSFYVSQGFHYLSDFVLSYKITFAIVIALVVLVIFNIFKKFVDDKYIVSRLHLLVMSCLLIGYVLYSGGDYMHGRSLLMFFILLVVALNDFVDLLIIPLVEHIKGEDLERPMIYTCILFGLLGLLLMLKSQVPITAIDKKQINNINDERSHFGITFDPDNYDAYMNIPITGEFSWRDRGYYYRDIAYNTESNISVNMPNIGFFGYAAGEDVNVKGAVLIDPWMSRQPILKRGKIGHENEIDWPYLLSRKPTFSYTPFKYWNTYAHAKYNKSQFVGVITDDSNDSFIPVFDISDIGFIKRYAEITGVNVKDNIDYAQQILFTQLNPKNLGNYDFDVKEYFSFLKVHWYPYANANLQKMYEAKRSELFGNSQILGSYEQNDSIKKSEILWDHVTGKLTPQKFVSNIFYALK